jgi:hypothetical protein
MGFDFTVTFSGTSTQSVASGQSASYTIVLTPLAGSSGTFTFACGTVPSNSICTFNPAGETLNAGVQGNVVVQVSTGGSTTTARSKAPGGGNVLPLVCGLLLLRLGWKWRHKNPHGAVQFALLAILGVGVVSCTSSGGGTGGGAGSSGRSGGSGTTSAGTYSIPVTVTSTGISHSVTLTLIVE